MSKKRKRRIIWFIILLLGLWLFKIPSHIHFVLDNNGEAFNTAPRHQKLLYQNDAVLIHQVNLRRKNTGIIKRIYNVVSRPKLYKITFLKNQQNFSVSLQKSGTTARKQIREGYNFSINSSFYDKQFNYRGEVTVKGKKHGRTSGSSGYFKVIGGKAFVGPKSLFENKAGKVDYSCQAHPSVMKNGTIWHYILNMDRGAAYLKSRTYRSLSGMDKDGQIVFIVSGNGGLINIKEAALIAKENGIQTATMLDAGAALQYSFKNKDFRLHFSSLNNQINLGRKVDKVLSKYLGKRFFNVSPVFINFKES